MQQDLNLLWFVDNFYTKLKLTTNNAHLVKKTGVELAQAERIQGLRPGWNDERLQCWKNGSWDIMIP